MYKEVFFHNDYMVQALHTFLNLINFKRIINSISSACGLPLKPVCPIEIILSFFTITHPTEGFDPVNPFLSSC